MTATYDKKYNNLPRQAIEEIVSKYNYLNSKLNETDCIFVPKVLNHSSSTITFSELPFNEMTSLRTIMCTEDFRTVTKYFRRAGTTLAHLHKILAKAGYVHGDFWPGNIFFWNEKIVIIDFEPADCDNWEISIHNDLKYDLIKFIKISETLFPILKWWRYPLNRRRWYLEFLYGYTKGGGVYDKQEVLHEVRRLFWKETRSILKLKNKNRPRRLGTFLYRIATGLCNPALLFR